MSMKVLVIGFLVSAYLVLSVWCLDVQNKVAGSASDKGVLDKRDLNTDATIGKFLDPTPEYYRGPGSTPSPFGINERDRFRDRDRDRDGLVIGLQRPPYGGSGYDSRFTPTRGPPGYGANNRDTNRFGSFQDRIGYGGGPSSYGSSNSYRPTQIPRAPYGPAVPIDFPSSYSGSQSGYGGSSYWKDKPYPSDDYIFPPVPPPANDYFSSFHHGGDKALSKSILLPLIGGAILGITAALVANPALLHIGALAGKRRRRGTDDASNAEDTTGKDGDHQEHAQKLAYKAYHGKLV